MNNGVFGGTRLHKLARSGQWTLLLASWDDDLAHTTNEHNRVPLHYAVESGAEDDVITALLQVSPFQLRVRDVSGNTALHLGCQFGMSLDVLQYMLELDELYTTDSTGVSLLLPPNNDGKTPLQLLDFSKKASRALDRVFQVGGNRVTLWKHNRTDYPAVLMQLEAATAQVAPVSGQAPEQHPRGDDENHDSLEDHLHWKDDLRERLDSFRRNSAQKSSEFGAKANGFRRNSLQWLKQSSEKLRSSAQERIQQVRSNRDSIRSENANNSNGWMQDSRAATEEDTFVIE